MRCGILRTYIADVVLKVIANFPLYCCREFVEIRTVLEFAVSIIARAVAEEFGTDASKGNVIHSWFELWEVRIWDTSEFGI